MSRRRETVWITCPKCGKDTEWLADEPGTYCGDSVCDTEVRHKRQIKAEISASILKEKGFKVWKGKRIYVNVANAYLDLYDGYWKGIKGQPDMEKVKELLDEGA